MMSIAEKYKEEGRRHGMCDKVFNELTPEMGKAELVKKWVANIDFAIHSDWPSVEQIKSDFGGVIHEHGVYADEEIKGCGKPIVVLNGKCDATLEYNNKTGRVYARHETKLKVTAMGTSRVFVSLYDDAEAEVTTGAFAKVYVYKHGRGKVASEGVVIVRERQA